MQIQYFTFEALNLHREKSTLEKIVPQGLIRNTEYGWTMLASDMRMRENDVTLGIPKSSYYQQYNGDFLIFSGDFCEWSDTIFTVT